MVLKFWKRCRLVVWRPFVLSPKSRTLSQSRSEFDPNISLRIFKSFFRGQIGGSFVLLTGVSIETFSRPQNDPIRSQIVTTMHPLKTGRNRNKCAKKKYAKIKLDFSEDSGYFPPKYCWKGFHKTLWENFFFSMKKWPKTNNNNFRDDFIPTYDPTVTHTILLSEALLILRNMLGQFLIIKKCFEQKQRHFNSKVELQRLENQFRTY